MPGTPAVSRRRSSTSPAVGELAVAIQSEPERERLTRECTKAKMRGSPGALQPEVIRSTYTPGAI